MTYKIPKEINKNSGSTNAEKDKNKWESILEKVNLGNINLYKDNSMGKIPLFKINSVG